MATFEVETDTNTMENPLASNGKPTELSATPSPVATSQMTEAVVGAHFESSWFSADGLLYGAGGQDKGVTLWDLETGASTMAVRTDANVLTTCAAPDDTSFVVGCGDGGFKLCAMLSPAQVRAEASAAVVWEVGLGREQHAVRHGVQPRQPLDRDGVRRRQRAAL
jgi:hypothetical protein